LRDLGASASIRSPPHGGAVATCVLLARRRAAHVSCRVEPAHQMDLLTDGERTRLRVRRPLVVWLLIVAFVVFTALVLGRYLSHVASSFVNDDDIPEVNDDNNGHDDDDDDDDDDDHHRS
jgi:hypothetical protein